MTATTLNIMSMHSACIMKEVCECRTEGFIHADGEGGKKANIDISDGETSLSRNNDPEIYRKRS
jgi:hypothetical protein